MQSAIAFRNDAPQRMGRNTCVLASIRANTPSCGPAKAWHRYKRKEGISASEECAASDEMCRQVGNVPQVRNVRNLSRVRNVSQVRNVPRVRLQATDVDLALTTSQDAAVGTTLRPSLRKTPLQTCITWWRVQPFK